MNKRDGLRRMVLPEDMLIKVFSWLPVKSLLRFRCLSKRWLDVISSDPYFIQLHSYQSKSKPPLLFSVSFYHPTKENFVLSSMDMEGNLLSEFDISTSNKGSTLSPRLSNLYLPVFIFPTCIDLVFFLSKYELHVCNPSTHELITLPPLLSLLSNNFGFGYVESTNEYKIVHLAAPFHDNGHFVEYNAEFKTQCNVFTLGMAKDSPSSYASPWAWKELGNSPRHVENYKAPAFVDGALHWLINRRRHPEIMNDIEKTILAFNLESEEFTLMPRPKGCCDLKFIPRFRIQLVELRGLLCLSYVKMDGKMDIWMLKDHHNQTHTFTWVIEYTIDLIPLMDTLYHLTIYEGSNIPKDMQDNGRFFVPKDIQDEGTKVLIETSDGKSVYYDIQTTSFSESFSYKRSGKFYYFYSFYKESLRSLRYVLQRSFKFDQVTGVTPSQSQQLAYMDPPIYIMRVFVHEKFYGGYLTNFRGGFVAIEGRLLDVGNITEAEAEAKAILYGLQFARGQGIECIGLISKAKELVDAIITRKRQTYQRLEKILNRITGVLSEFNWAQIFHDQRLSTQVACQVATQAKANGKICFNEPPEWFVDG